MELNSKEFWEDYFESLKWENNFGEEQTQLFADILIKNIPDEVLITSKSALDFGCALGQLCNSLKSFILKSKIIGYDFSEVACEKARNLFPELTFVSSQPNQKFDLVCCSNVLEHMVEFEEYLKILCNYSKKYVVILVPYRAGISASHVREFIGGEFQENFQGFKKIKESIIDVYDCRLWNGQQQLVVYKLTR